MAQIDQKYIDEGVAWIDKKDLQLYRDITAYNEQALDGRQRMRFSKQIRFGFALINPLVAGCLFLVILSTEPVIPPAMKWVLPAFFCNLFSGAEIQSLLAAHTDVGGTDVCGKVDICADCNQSFVYFDHLFL